jgi:hypothetical protein
VRRRQRRYAVNAASAGIATAATLYATTGPNAIVIGDRRTASPGIDVVQVRLTPAGAQTACDTKGFWPWSKACGHHASDQMKISGSRPLPM